MLMISPRPRPLSLFTPSSLGEGSFQMNAGRDLVGVVPIAWVQTSRGSVTTMNVLEGINIWDENRHRPIVEGRTVSTCLSRAIGMAPKPIY